MKVELDWLLRVRVVIARCGEMDAQRWWNTEGQLGPYGAKVLKRGFPRTHHFAQARSVFAVAAHRCAEVFDPPDAATFWRLSDAVEEAFDARWEGWLDVAPTWVPFSNPSPRSRAFRSSTTPTSRRPPGSSSPTAKRGSWSRAPSISDAKRSPCWRSVSGAAPRATFVSHIRRRGRHEAGPGLLPTVPAQGPVVEETYRIFSGWNDDKTVSENLDLAFLGRFPTIAWEREVRVTTLARLKNIDALRPLIVLARNGMKLDDWRDCWRLWIGATEEPFGGFVRDWLFPQMRSGRHQFRAQDVLEYAIKAWSLHSPKRPLSEHGVVRAARDLVHTAAQLGMVSGDGLVKTFSAMPIGDDVLLFYVQMIADLEGSTAKVPGSDLWRMMMIPASEAHVVLLDLHQFKRLDYQVAGSLVQLTLPYPSALAFAESLSR